MVKIAAAESRATREIPPAVAIGVLAPVSGMGFPEELLELVEQLEELEELEGHEELDELDELEELVELLEDELDESD